MSPTLLTLIVLGSLVLLAGGLVVAGLVGVATGGEDLSDRMHAYAAIPELNQRRETNRRRSGLVRMRVRLNAMLSTIASEKLNLQLMSADWPVTVVEYVAIRLGATVLGVLLAWLIFRSLVSGVAFGVIIYMIPGIYLKRSIHKRQNAFARQLVDVLTLINGAVRAGFSLMQATEVVVKEMQSPASDEFRRVQREVGLGIPISRSLQNLCERMDNDDLNLVVTAININYQVGGNLATMLGAVSETIRDRIRLFAEVRVITTQQRYTSYLLTMLPFFVAGILFMMRPDYMSRLFDRQWLCIPIGALIGIMLGNMVIRRLGKIEV